MEGPKGWIAFSRSKWIEIPQYVTGVAHSGERSVMLTNYDKGIVQYNPWVMYDVEADTKANNQ